MLCTSGRNAVATPVTATTAGGVIPEAHGGGLCAAASPPTRAAAMPDPAHSRKRRIPRSSGTGSAAVTVWGAGLDGDGAVAAGRADELPDAPVGRGLGPVADGQGGEHDGQVRFDGVALAVVDRPGLQVAFRH